MWEQWSMAQMASGVSEIYAMHLFTQYKYELAHTVIDAAWASSTDSERNDNEDLMLALKSFDIYTLKGVLSTTITSCHCSHSR